MSNPHEATGAAVVHIRAGDPGESERMDTLLNALPVRTITWTDVYRGLARLGHLAKDRKETERLKAIVVHVGALGAAEMEFFPIVSRTLPRVPVLVYGPTAASAQIAAALNHGASGVATEEAVLQITASRDAEGFSKNAAAPDVRPTPRRANADAGTTHVPSQPIPYSPVKAFGEDPASEEPGEPEADSENVTDDPFVPRVPWLRYEGSPARQAPTRVPPAPRHDANNAAPTNDGGDREEHFDDSEPLLTEEELRALIGDDVSSIVPQEPVRRGPTAGAQDGDEG